MERNAEERKLGKLKYLAFSILKKSSSLAQAKEHAEDSNNQIPYPFVR